MKALEEAQVEFYKILSIAINLDEPEREAYLRQQREILRMDMTEEQKEKLSAQTKKRQIVLAVIN